MPLSQEQLDAIDGTGQVRIGTRTNGKTIRTIIWVVVADSDVYVRSVQGEAGNWYQRARSNPAVTLEVGDEEFSFEAVHIEDEATIELVSQALRDKYPPGGPLDRMTRSEVLNTTLRLDPA